MLAAVLIHEHKAIVEHAQSCKSLLLCAIPQDCGALVVTHPGIEQLRNFGLLEAQVGVKLVQVLLAEVCWDVCDVERKP